MILSCKSATSGIVLVGIGFVATTILVSSTDAHLSTCPLARGNERGECVNERASGDETIQGSTRLSVYHAALYYYHDIIITSYLSCHAGRKEGVHGRLNH